jgi:phospholipid/cholesterol/gamma-HCH transport system substrate-binding protein
MATRKFESIKLGLFVITMLIIFTYGIYRLGNSKSFFGNSIELYCEFDDAKGLREGNNVRFNGIAIGTVSKIEIKDHKTLLIAMDVDKSITNYMKTDAVATINSDGLVGNMVINVKNSSDQNSEFVKDGTILNGVDNSGLDSVVQSLSGTNEKIIQIVDNLVDITGAINEGEGTVASLLDDPMLASNLKASVAAMNTTIRKINSMANTFDRMLKETESGKNNLGYLFSDNSLSEQINGVSNNLDSLTSYKIDPILNDLSITSRELKTSSESINSVLTKMQEDNTIVDRLLHDTLLMHNLNQSLLQINQGTMKFDETMGALQQQWLIKRLLRKYKDEEN